VSVYAKPNTREQGENHKKVSIKFQPKYFSQVSRSAIPKIESAAGGVAKFSNVNYVI
jgi:hypothetical protein